MHNVVFKNRRLKDSRNSWDWLGHGAYFWENSPSRAMEFAQSQSKKEGTSIKKPAVLGAVLSLGYCLDLLDYKNISHLKTGYELLREAQKIQSSSEGVFRIFHDQ